MKNLSFQIIQDSRFPNSTLSESINKQIVAVRTALKQFNVSFLISEPRRIDWDGHFQYRADVYIAHLKTDRLQIIDAINKSISAPVYKNFSEEGGKGSLSGSRLIRA